MAGTPLLSLRTIRSDAGARVLHHIDLYLFEQYGAELPAFVRRQVDIELEATVRSAAKYARRTARTPRTPK